MYVQNGIAADVSKGPHFMEPRIDPAVRAAEIDGVIAMATARMPKAAMRKLGKLSNATAAEDDAWTYFAQIRSEPMGPAGIEFRFPMPARDTGRQDLSEVAAELVLAARTSAKVAGKLGPYGEAVRETAEGAISKATGGIAGMRVVAIGITPPLPGVEMRTTVDVEMLGCDLKPAVERVTDSELDGLEKQLTDLAAAHLVRRKALAQSRALDATGWIDGAARLILDAAGLDVAAVVERLRGQYEVEFHFGGVDGYDLAGAVYWVDGTIRGFVENRARENTFRLRTSELLIEAARLPATEADGLIGRRLRDVIDIGFVPLSALIVDVRRSEGWVYLDLEIGWSTIEEAIRSPSAPPRND